MGRRRVAQAKGSDTSPTQLRANVHASHGVTEKRVRILQAGMRVFARNGFQRTSVETVAIAAGVSKQTVYNHFGDKKGLITAVVSTAADPLAEEFDTILGSTLADCTDLRANFEDFGRRWVRLLLGPDTSALRWVMLAESESQPELLAAWGEVSQEGALRQIAGRIERLTQIGQLDVPDAWRAARQLRALLLGEAERVSAFGRVALREEEIHELVASGIDIFLRAYAPAGKTNPPHPQ
ncbi:TetR/AcrR family transcriptional regulator [Nocardiopsis rhodophaea]|uniref:TetR/AcrR family transcriptional regulator n=1 Tax=Nocardiopsis rhodophaea TaxID=280238 RepID=UPI0031E2C81D